MFIGLIYQQTIYPNCALFLADLLAYLNEAEFIQNIVNDKKKKPLVTFLNFTFRYIDNVLSHNNPHFNNCLNLLIQVNLRLRTLPTIGG